jgi:hypothetical protein
MGAALGGGGNPILATLAATPEWGHDIALAQTMDRLDKVLFWLVLAWMVGLLAMAILAVLEVWKEDARSTGEEKEGEAPAQKPASEDEGRPVS